MVAEPPLGYIQNAMALCWKMESMSSTPDRTGAAVIVAGTQTAKDAEIIKNLLRREVKDVARG